MIRPATLNDIATLCLMARQFYSVGNLEGTGLECDIGSIASVMESLIDDSQSSTVLVAVSESGEIIGTIAGRITPWMFNVYQTVLSELWWFVPEQHRSNKMAAARLLSELKRWGRSKGAKHMVISSTERPEQEMVINMYAKLGLRLKDVNFIGRL